MFKHEYHHTGLRKLEVTWSTDHDDEHSVIISVSDPTALIDSKIHHFLPEEDAVKLAELILKRSKENLNEHKP